MDRGDYPGRKSSEIDLIDLDNDEANSNAAQLDKTDIQFKSLEIKNDRNSIDIGSVNFPEKIIFVIDTGTESACLPFNIKQETYCKLCLLKHAIEIFFHNKTIINQKHEFALVTLDPKKAHWLCDFTSNIKELLDKLVPVQECRLRKDQKSFNLQQVFHLFHEKINTTELLKQNSVRVILLYTRSNVVPVFDISEEVVQSLLKHHNFYLDILYLHDKPTDENNCNEIFSELNKLEVRNRSLMFRVDRNPKMLYCKMASLMSHPGLRHLN